MRRKRYTVEQIISIFREVDVKLSRGRTWVRFVEMWGLLNRPIIVGEENMVG